MDSECGGKSSPHSRTTATEYTYDDQYQLTKEKLRNNTLVYDYSYDTAGNILSMSETKNGTTTTKNFTYGDAQWQDLLTAVNGNSITYDAIGNPLQYHNGKNWTFTWVKGRSLNTAVSGDTIASYQYGSDGVRIKKTVGDKVHEYTYLGGVLVEDRCGEDTIRFTYDGQGRPHSMTYQGETYFYILNQQGDVLCLMNNDRGVMASYEYNAWGEVLNVTGILGDVNPLRYRGYYYDSETGFYYLNSRYYDPEIGRFINSDDMIAGIGDNILGYNMFAYCFNNPVNMSDSDGNWPEWLDKAINAVAKTVKKAVKVATKWVKKAKKKVEKICGFTTQIDKEKPIKPKYRGIVSCETGSGYNKSFSTGKSVNIYNTIPNISEDIFDAGIGIDFNINGYGASMQNGVESSFSINLPKQSFEVGSRPLGRKYFKYSYIDSSGVYAYQKYILNTPELGGALLLLYYQPNIALVGAAGLAGGAYAY